MGHPEPFNMTMIGVGNEQWGPQFIERYEIFHRALKEKHPEITIVSGSGPAPHDDRYDYLWPELRRLNADIVDEHCYANPNWFFTAAHRYDDFPRSGPKAFMGEYAAQSDRIVSVINENNLECALSEAAFMTGMERNADVVRMSSYAPLFAHIDAWQWRPNLIWCDNLRVMGTPNYHVQKLFSLHSGDVALPVKLEPDQQAYPGAGRIGVGTYNTSAEFKEIRVTRMGVSLFENSWAQEWEESGGNWEWENDMRRQTRTRGEAFAYAGDSSWSDYTLSLKARKLRGSEGFAVVVRHPSPNTRIVWNLGGWGNTKHGIQELLGVQPREIAQVPGSIEADRWYDVRIELIGTQMKCYLDGELIQSADVPGPTAQRFFASAVLDEEANEVVLKVVNAEPEPATVNINLNGAQVRGSGRAIVLAGEDLSDVNTLDDPMKLYPVEHQTAFAGSSVRHEFKPYSLTILRLPTGR
jgi:alpha-L-arabinofuranosidase